jgi:hypothetical protein
LSKEALANNGSTSAGIGETKVGLVDRWQFMFFGKNFRKVKRAMRNTVLILMLFMLIPGSALATSFTMDLLLPDLIPTLVYGTLTIEDDATKPNLVKVTIELVDPNYKIQEFMLNYDDSLFPVSGYTFSWVSGNTTLLDEQNHQKADGYNAGSFDIQTPATGNLDTSAFTDYLQYSNESGSLYDLNASMFIKTDTSGMLYGAVHVGNINAAGDSIWVGSSHDPTGVDQPAVPESTTLLLIGTGLIGIAFTQRKRVIP